jgi:poly(A) polymerase
MKIDPTPLYEAFPGALKIIDVLENARSSQIQMVGGCVRDFLMGRDVKDIDFATPLTPDIVRALFQRAGYTVIDTGLAHGTVTVMVDKVPFEITTLRRDVATDGRRATIAFAQDWRDDAFRRDFRFNALYLSPDGYITDYSDGDGIRDAERRRIEFMGDADTRVKEDYLRILRLLRFQSVLHATAEDDALAACADNVAGLKIISGERIAMEGIKLLQGQAVRASLENMAEIGAFDEVFCMYADDVAIKAIIDRLNRAHYFRKYTSELTALVGWNAHAARRLAERWKVSRELREIFTDVIEAGPIDLDTTSGEFIHTAYRQGEDLTKRRLAQSWVVSGEGPREPVKELLAQTIPTFPLGGREVLALGVEAGPEVGELLRKVEDQWAQTGYVDNFPFKGCLATVVGSRGGGNQ